MARERVRGGKEDLLMGTVKQSRAMAAGKVVRALIQPDGSVWFAAADIIDAFNGPGGFAAIAKRGDPRSATVAAFIVGALKVTGDADHRVRTADLYNTFCTWCRARRLTPLTRAAFDKRLPAAAQDAGIIKLKSSSSLYTGIQVIDKYHPVTNKNLCDGKEQS
jgi:hypothetical protein